MFYLTSKFHVNCIDTFGFIEGGGVEASPPQAQELQKSPGPEEAAVSLKSRKTILADPITSQAAGFSTKDHLLLI